MIDTKPREFWIKNTNAECDYATIDVIDSEIAITRPNFSKRIWRDFKRSIHVIEYSAYQAKCDEFDGLSKTHTKSVQVAADLIAELEKELAELREFKRLCQETMKPRNGDWS